MRQMTSTISSAFHFYHYAYNYPLGDVNTSYTLFASVVFSTHTNCTKNVSKSFFFPFLFLVLLLLCCVVFSFVLIRSPLVRSCVIIREHLFKHDPKMILQKSTNFFMFPDVQFHPWSKIKNLTDGAKKCSPCR